MSLNHNAFSIVPRDYHGPINDNPWYGSDSEGHAKPGGYDDPVDILGGGFTDSQLKAWNVSQASKPKNNFWDW